MVGERGRGSCIPALCAAFRLRSSAASVVLRTGADLAKWLPGDAVFEDPLFVPEDLAAGNYELSVAMLGPLTLQPAIRLGIEGRGTDGWYALGKLRVSPAREVSPAQRR